MTQGWETALQDLFATLQRLLPALLGALVLLLAGWLVGRLLAGALRRLLVRVGLDRLTENADLKEAFDRAGISQPPSALLAQVVFWVVLLVFVVAALDTLGLQEPAALLERLIGFLPRLLAALFLLIGGTFLAQFLGRAAQAAAEGLRVEYAALLGRLTRIVLLTIVALLAVEQLGVDLGLLRVALVNLVTVIAAGFVLALALGGREIIHNALAGYYARDLFRPGDRLRVDGVEGTLEGIGPLNAEIRADGRRLILPNSRLIEAAVELSSAGAEEPRL